MLGVTPHKRIFPSFFVYFFCVFFLIFKFSKERVYKVKRMVLGSIPNGGIVQNTQTTTFFDDVRASIAQ